jgi:Dolichyl-phosphate-mannose-protein mannosyltransferase
MTRVSTAPITLAALVVAAMSVRLQHLDQPPLNFHPTRQYRSALIARACYYEHADVPEWARAVARANRDIQPAAEPPVMEWLACSAYRTVGAERLDVPRALASAFWVLGAVPLFAVMTSMASSAAAIVAVATYLFVPYGIVASRAFQPDALMTCCALWAMWALARISAHPTSRGVVVAALAAGLATVVKPMSMFLTVPAAVAFAVARGGLPMAARARILALATVLGLTSGAAYYGHSAIFGTLTRDQIQLRFVPSLLGTPFFWRGMWTQIEHVFGPLLFSVMVIGTVMAPRGLARTLLVSLWGGYAAFAVVFSYHMSTHDYYHLPFLALAALALATFYKVAIGSRLRRQSMSVAVVAGACIAVSGTMRALPAIPASDAERVKQYEEIGELAEHSTRVLFLDQQYGYVLMYHGQISGDAWPTTDDLTAAHLGGLPLIDAHQRYARDFADYGATHFIVTDLASLEAQPDLQKLLSEIAAVVTRTPTYHVYRLTERKRGLTPFRAGFMSKRGGARSRNGLRGRESALQRVGAVSESAISGRRVAGARDESRNRVDGVVQGTEPFQLAAPVLHASRRHHAQLGGYRALLEQHGHEFRRLRRSQQQTRGGGTGHALRRLVADAERVSRKGETYEGSFGARDG